MRPAVELAVAVVAAIAMSALAFMFWVFGALGDGSWNWFWTNAVLLLVGVVAVLVVGIRQFRARRAGGSPPS